MKKTEQRAMEVSYCDGCGGETNYLNRCLVCGKEYCMAEGGQRHFAFAIEDVYNYATQEHKYNLHICTDCVGLNPQFALQVLLNGIMASRPILPYVAKANAA